MLFEVGNSYSGLALLPDGRILIPCNVDVRLLIEFLQENEEKSREMRKQTMREKVDKFLS